MKKQAPIKESLSLPFGLCDECAVLFTAAFSLTKQPGVPGQMVTCSNCKRKRPGAEYIKEG